MGRVGEERREQLVGGGGIALDQTGFPDAMGERVYYAPTERGLEARFKEKLDALRAARARARGEDGDA